jgi:hypothetical protein
MAWRQIKDYIQSHNITADMSLTRLQELVQGIKVMPEDWGRYCHYITNTENSCRERCNYGGHYNFIIICDTHSSNGDSDTGSDTEDVKLFMSDFISLQCREWSVA